MKVSNRIDDKQLIDQVESLLKNEFDAHDEFNQALNGADPVTIPSLDHDHDGYQFETSELLFFADRDAYYNEREIWDNASIADAHKDSIDAIKKYDQLPIFKELVDAIVRRRVAPFIGAGMSFACGYPMWGAALSELKGRVEGVDEAAFQKALDEYDYLEAAQLLWDKDDTQLKNFIRTKFSDGRLPDGNVTGPVLRLPHICHGCVITTNFDHVIETAFKKSGREPFEGYMHGVQAGNKFVPKLIKGDRCILKLHGDAEDHDSYIFTKKQYDDAYGDPFDFTNPLPRALRQIFVSHSLLFLGCSLETDKTLELFTHVCEQGDFEIPNHFAILPEPSGGGETKAQIETRLLKLKIHPIWFPNGDFHLVEAYLSLLIDASTKRIRV